MQYIYYLGLILSVISAPIVNAKNYGDVVNVTLVRVYDGDTFRVNINSWPQVIGENTPVRIKGIDTPEIRGRCASEKQQAQLAKQFTQQHLLQASQIELRNIERGKYFRLVADVYVDGENLAQLLTNAGLSYSYNGGKRQSWCS